MEKFSIITFGCRLNQYQSEKIREWLLACNLYYTENPEEADTVIVNGCVVTHRGERDTRKTIHKYIKKGKQVIATGCYAKLPYTKLEKGIIFKTYEEIFTDFTPEHPPLFSQSRHRTLIGIQEGCDFKCSYCIVPFVRGKARDRNPHEIVREIESYVQNGTKEIVLTGTDIGRYGKTSNIQLSTLIRRIKERFPELFIRLSSILPPHVTGDIIDLFRERILLPHIHLPLQSGSDKVLKSMRRPYKLQTYLDAFWELYESNSNMAIGTDIIVGFPTETDEDFEKTYELIEELPFAYAHVFLYSKRPFTEAFKLKELPYSLIKQREKRLLKLVARKKRDFIGKFIGKPLMAIAEYTNHKFIKGTTENYIKFIAPTGDSKIIQGDAVKITITDTIKDDFSAKAILLS